MINIENSVFDANTLPFDLFVFTINYEARSCFLFDSLRNRLNSSNTLLIVTDNYLEFTEANEKICKIKDQVEFASLPYLKSEKSFINTVSKAIKKRRVGNQPISVFVDYSSLPRKWYCLIPKLIEEELSANDKIYFWYTEGTYTGSQERFPTAGTDAYCFFDGQPSLLAQSRTHIIGLSYDAIRTRGIIQKTDPEYLILLEAHDYDQEDIYRNLLAFNAEIIPQAGAQASLDISDFSYMVKRIQEIVRERLQTDDVILIPDGPKPLILAMSMMPLLIKKRGVTCIHVARNMAHFVPVKVASSGKVVGFMIRKTAGNT